MPLFVTNAIDGLPLPVYGDGLNVRDWLYVDDNCAGIDLVLRDGEPGQVYNIGGGHEVPNIELTREILRLLNRDESLIRWVSGPARPRPPLLHRLLQAQGPRLVAAGGLRRGPRPHRRLVPDPRGLVAANQVGRVPRVLRAAVRLPDPSRRRARHGAGEAAYLMFHTGVPTGTRGYSHVICEL